MIAAVIARLEALTIDGAPVFKDVHGALQLSDIVNQPINRAPAAFVIPLDENPRPDVRGSGPALQEVVSGVGVVMALQSLNTRTGGKDIDPLTAVRKAVRKSLFGWPPEAGYEPFTLGSGRLLSLLPGTVFWVDRFVTEYTEDAL